MGDALDPLPALLATPPSDVHVCLPLAITLQQRCEADERYRSAHLPPHAAPLLAFISRALALPHLGDNALAMAVVLLYLLCLSPEGVLAVANATVSLPVDPPTRDASLLHHVCMLSAAAWLVSPPTIDALVHCLATGALYTSFVLCALEW